MKSDSPLDSCITYLYHGKIGDWMTTDIFYQSAKLESPLCTFIILRGNVRLETGSALRRRSS